MGLLDDDGEARASALRAGESVPMAARSERLAYASRLGGVGFTLLVVTLLIPQTDPRMYLLGRGWGLLCSGVAVILCLPICISTWQLQPGEFHYRTWSGRLHPVPYRALLSLRWSQMNRWNKAPKLRLCYRAPSGRERTLTFQSRLGYPVVLTALREELIRRGELVQLEEGVWEAQGEPET